MPLIYGFEEILEKEVREYGATAVLYRHAATGAELLSLITDDENKVFGAVFRTPPADSTGVAHILEHSVLCGSRRYPVKEPFVELLKGSLHTFLNAFTYPDKTCYPVASANTADFYNLVDVYLDAVFHPLIPEHVFRQEGWHYDFADDGALTRNGVVYNEMKGAYSAPDGVLAEFSQRLLFPDNAYGVDSGGDPQAIPDLTYAQFKAFHETYYHPSNARFFFHGDDDPTERLRLVDACISEFGRLDVDSAVALQQPFKEPVRARIPYAVEEGDGDGREQKRGMVTINWLLPDTEDQELVLSLDILEHILIGLSSSPLRKALIDSGLGEDMAGAGLEGELRQMFFSTGLKGIDPAESGRVENLVMETLRGLAADGLDFEAVEAGCNALEFSLRENNTGAFPRGLSLMLRSLTTWLYGGDPTAPLCFEAPLARIKARLDAGERLFEDLLTTYFLENRHKAVLTLEPDPGLAETRLAEERGRLEEERERMGEEGMEQARQTLKRLRTAQKTPDSPEALASIPRLGAADLPRDNALLPSEPREPGGVAARFHDLSTNGVVYLEVGFDMSAVPAGLLPLVPLFARSLLETGTDKEDFVTLSRRIARKTGGIGRQSFLSSIKGRDPKRELRSKLFFRGKAAVDKAGDLLDILSDVLLSADLDNRGRISQMALEARARAERRLVPSGHAAASSRLRARFGRAGWAAEQMSGVSNLFYLKDLVERIEDDWDGVRADLETLRERLLTRNGLIVNITLDRRDYEPFESALGGFLEKLPDRESAPETWDVGVYPRAEGVVIPAQVNYVGAAFNMYDLGYEFHGSALVAARHLRMAYLWDRVRVRGGAYGAFCAFDRIGGPLAFVSYRDPNTAATLEAFAGAGAYLQNAELSDDELERAIIGAVGDLDSYMLPDAKGHAALARELTGDDEEGRARMRREVFETTREHLKAFGACLSRGAAAADVVVLGSSRALEDLAAEFEAMNLLKPF